MGVSLQKVDQLYPSYIDLEDDISRVILSLAEPHNDAAYSSYPLIIRTNQTMDTEDSIVSIPIKGDKLIPLTESNNDNPFQSKTISNFFSL